MKRTRGMSFTRSVERGVLLLDESLTIGEPMTPPERTALGLLNSPRPANRRKGGAL
ncbi:MAG: hypothetical protein ABMA26_07405 [Limisphaerales bacterium]